MSIGVVGIRIKCNVFFLVWFFMINLDSCNSQKVDVEHIFVEPSRSFDDIDKKFLYVDGELCKIKQWLYETDDRSKNLATNFENFGAKLRELEISLDRIKNEIKRNKDKDGDNKDKDGDNKDKDGDKGLEKKVNKLEANVAYMQNLLSTMGNAFANSRL